MNAVPGLRGRACRRRTRPSFRRPDAYVSMSEADRERYGQASNDLCRIDPRDGASPRHFLRAVLPIEVHGRAVPLNWGIWVEVLESTFHRVRELWSDPDQTSEPPMEGVLANAIPSYESTLGLHCLVRLTGPTTRPAIWLADAEHLLAQEQRSGVSEERATQWVHLFD